MPRQFLVEDTAWTFELHAPNERQLKIEKLRQMIELLVEFNAAVSLATFSVQNGNPNDLVWQYTFVARDGREWTQSIRLVAGNDVYEATFDVPEYWRRREFTPHRPIRDLVAELLTAQPDITRIEMTWR